MAIRTFELFLSLDATNSFSDTATLLGTTQSSVSKSIGAMEREFATVRTGRWLHRRESELEKYRLHRQRA